MVKGMSGLIYKNFGLNTRINLTTIGIFIFSFVIGIYKSFLYSTFLVFLLLLISLVLLLFNMLIINEKGINITRVDIMWLLFLMLFILNITYNNLITSGMVFDIFIYASGIFFLLLTKVEINNFDSSLKLIKLLGVVYALSAIFQYLYTDLYLSYVLPMFSEGEQSGILALLRENSYSGFTTQTAHLAGYIVSGIGIIMFSNWKVKASTKILSFVSLLILFTGLLLTSKRAHLFFLIAAILITVLFSVSNKKFIEKTLQLIISITIVLLLMLFVINALEFREDSPIAEFMTEIDITVKGLIEGEDVSSGRSTLFSHSWELFKENPLVGIGWQNFLNDYSQGLIRSDTGSHPHNIYLQLLTEFGLIGFLLFMIPVVYVYYKTYQLVRLLSNENNSLIKWKSGVRFSFFSQTFFLLYGLTGNLLTDYNFLLMYFFACSISLAAMVKIKPHHLY